MEWKEAARQRLIESQGGAVPTWRSGATAPSVSSNATAGGGGQREFNSLVCVGRGPVCVQLFSLGSTKHEYEINIQVHTSTGDIFFLIQEDHTAQRCHKRT